MNVAVAGFEFAIGAIIAIGFVWALAHVLSFAAGAIVGLVGGLWQRWRRRRQRAWKRFPDELRYALGCGLWRVYGDVGSSPPCASDPMGQILSSVELPRKWGASDILSPIRDPHLMLPADIDGTPAAFRPTDNIECVWGEDARDNRIYVYFRKQKP